MSLMPELVVQRISQAPNVPDDATLSLWASAALATAPGAGELVIRIVDEAESLALNSQYRGMAKPTNVLSFPADTLPGIDDAPLGDLVICAPLVAAQAAEQNKSPMAHWAHLVIHGCLHLLGYDHQNDAQAEVMEAMETRLLVQWQYPDPYQ